MDLGRGNRAAASILLDLTLALTRAISGLPLSETSGCPIFYPRQMLFVSVPAPLAAIKRHQKLQVSVY